MSSHRKTYDNPGERWELLAELGHQSRKGRRIAPPVRPPLPRPDRRARSTVVMVLGIVSLLIWPLGPVATMLGYLALRHGDGPWPLGFEKAVTGTVCGAVASVVLTVIVLSTALYHIH